MRVKHNCRRLGRRFGMGCLGYLVCSLAAPAWATTITVTTPNDVVALDGLCSLREAITSVNTAAASGNLAGECPAGDGNNDTIVVPAGTYTLTINGPDEDNNATGDLDILANVTIQGAAIGSTIVDGSGFDATTPDRVFDLPVSGVTVTFQNLTIQNGHAPDGISGGMFGFPTPGEDGGGIRVLNATVTLASVALSQISRE